MVVPGSVANLGGGFDTLGVAVQLYLRARIVDVRDDGGSRLTVARSTPPVCGQNAVERAFEAMAQQHGSCGRRRSRSRSTATSRWRPGSAAVRLQRLPASGCSSV